MEINSIIDSLKDDLIKSTQDIVRIKSVNGEPKPGKPFGEDTNLALEKTLELCESLGFKTVNLDGYVGYAEYGQGDDYVAVLGHLDVVPEGDGWQYPPYGVEIHDGKMFGRGTMDDKGPTIAALYGLKAIKEAKLPLSKRIRIIFGTNEETGAADIPHYIEKEKPPVLGFTPDGEFPIIYGEKGIARFYLTKELKLEAKKDIKIKYIKGGTAANVVPDYCEAGIQCSDPEMVIRAVQFFAKRNGYNIEGIESNGLVVIKSVGVSAHGSLPELGENAVMRMVKFLAELPIGYCDLQQYLRFLNNFIGEETQGQSLGIYLEDRESGKLSLNVGIIDMSEDKISVSLDIRYPVTKKYSQIKKVFDEKLENTGIFMEKYDLEDPLFFDESHELIKILQKVYKGQTGDEPKLLAIGGGTYAKSMENTVAFGPLFPGEPDFNHKPNEYIKLEDLVRCAKIYGNAIYELAK